MRKLRDKREKYWSVYMDSISNEQLEARKQHDREYKKAFPISIASTKLHEKIKRQKRENRSVYMDSISDEPLEA